ncbi:MAG TPA: GvpL/GvpF family gas vesicle protein [Terriglobales bacterium]|jgi:hypothetical protein|nr:GvpL/GvpF family gas vesicle protein [Terriglobales bacterium]
MSILLYCVTERTELPNLGSGVADLPVLSVEHGELAVLFSPDAWAEGWTGAPLKQSARQFHQVLHRVFESRAIIPFRFPTLMQEAQELATHMRANVPEYMAQLQKFRSSVQMDISIAYSDSARASGQASGAEYLRDRRKRSEELDRIANQLYTYADSVPRDWRTRPAQHGLKIFALLDRDSVEAFNRNLQRFAVPAGLSIRISGPWPVTAFLELRQHD